MLMSFEEFEKDELEILEKAICPSFFDLLCLFPLSSNFGMSDSQFLFDDFEFEFNI